jgi:hypothetical protein
MKLHTLLDLRGSIPTDVQLMRAANHTAFATVNRKFNTATAASLRRTSVTEATPTSGRKVSCLKSCML